MDGNTWWVLGWGTLTVLAGAGCVLAAPHEERASTAIAYAGTSVLVVCVSVILWALGVWPA